VTGRQIKQYGNLGGDCYSGRSMPYAVLMIARTKPAYIYRIFICEREGRNQAPDRHAINAPAPRGGVLEQRKLMV